MIDINLSAKDIGGSIGNIGALNADDKWNRKNVGRQHYSYFNKNSSSGKSHGNFIQNFSEKKFVKTQELGTNLDINAIRTGHYTNNKIKGKGQKGLYQNIHNNHSSKEALHARIQETSTTNLPSGTQSKSKKPNPKSSNTKNYHPIRDFFSTNNCKVSEHENGTTVNNLNLNNQAAMIHSQNGPINSLCVTDNLKENKQLKIKEIKKGRRQKFQSYDLNGCFMNLGESVESTKRTKNKRNVSNYSDRVKQRSVVLNKSNDYYKEKDKIRRNGNTSKDKEYNSVNMRDISQVGSGFMSVGGGAKANKMYDV